MGKTPRPPRFTLNYGVPVRVPQKAYLRLRQLAKARRVPLGVIIEELVERAASAKGGSGA